MSNGFSEDRERPESVTSQQGAARRTEARNRLLLGGGAIIVVVAVVLTFVLIKVTSVPSAKSSHPAASAKPAAAAGVTGTALSKLITRVTTVPARVLDTVGAGKASARPASISGAPLTTGGKPEVVYMGAEYCPYCAAQRWAMVVALSRFGTFTGLATSHSAAVNGAGEREPYPDTSTWTFAHATYTSAYLAFTPVEMNTNIPDAATGGYTSLATPTKAQQALLDTYDVPPYVPNGDQGSIPFIDLANRYLSVGASLDPGVLQGLGWQQIAADLDNANSPVGQAVLGAANYLTAAICKLTNNQPAGACTQVVRSLEAQL